MIDIKKLLPSSAIELVDKRLKEDLIRYKDPLTGQLKKNLSEVIEICPACESQDWRYEFKKYVFNYVKCNNCGLLHVRERLNDNELDKLYGNDGRSVLQMKNLYIPTADYRMNTIYNPKAKKIANLKPNGKLLDFGCSAGFFIKAACNQGLDAYGIETNEFSVNFARELNGTNKIYEGDIRETSLEKNNFDLITMFDVFEHVPDPSGLLKVLNPYLKKSGILVIETSHIDCFEHEYLKAENTNVLGDVHLMHFTQKSIEIIANRSGFNIINKKIFGLDIAHIINFCKRNKKKEMIEMPNELIKLIQNNLDDMGRGCYINVELQKI